MSRSPRAFTLIEMVVVIGILAVLAAVLLPVILQPYIQEKRAEAAHEMAAIEQAIVGRPEAGEFGYLGTVGALPGQVQDLLLKPAAVSAPPVVGGVPQTVGGTVIGWVGPYLSTNGLDPLLDPWARPYSIVSTVAGAQVQWMIHSDGPDRTPGSADDLNYPRTGNPWNSVVTSLTVSVMRVNGPALAPPPANTPVTLIIPNGSGGQAAISAPATSAVTNSDGLATFTSTAAQRIPIGRIGVQVLGFTRTITAVRNVSYASVTIPADPSAFQPQVPCWATGAGVAATTTLPAGGCAGPSVVPGQLVDVTFTGSWKTSDATKPCYAAISFGDVGATTLSNGGARIFGPAATSSLTTGSLMLNRTYQAASSGTVNFSLTVQPTTGATCSVDGSLIAKTWKP